MVAIQPAAATGGKNHGLCADSDLVSGLALGFHSADCPGVIRKQPGGGHISQQGTYEELAARDGLFRELIRCQNAEAIQ